MTKKQPNQITKLKKKCLKTSSIILCATNCIAILLKQPEFVASSIIGWSCSYLILNNLINTQINILVTKKKSIVFINFLSRLCLYALPIILTLTFKNHLNLFIILIFLLQNQVIWIILELIESYTKLKKKTQKEN